MADEILNVLQEMLETDRAFYAMSRFLSPDRRDGMILNHMQNNRQIADLLRVLAPFLAARSIIVRPNVSIREDFFDPVRVTPSQEQIRNATETEVSVADTTCAICQDAVTSATRIRHCQHSFHANCINDWFELNARCPVCRHDIRQ